MTNLLCLNSTPREKGAQVTLEGTVAIDRNVGMGVNPVVLENVTVR